MKKTEKERQDSRRGREGKIGGQERGKEIGKGKERERGMQKESGRNKKEKFG